MYHLPIVISGDALMAARETEKAKKMYTLSLERLAGLKIPRSFDFIETMPRDPNGKLYKRKLRDPYWEGREVAI